MSNKKRNSSLIDEELEQVFDSQQFKRLLNYLMPYKKKVFITLLIIFLSTLAGLITPFLFKVAIDDYIPASNKSGLVILSLIFIVVILISSISVKYRIRYMSQIGQYVVSDMRKDIFVHLQKLPFTYFDSRPHGKILVRVVNYVNTISQLISNGLINLVTDLFTFVVALIIMFVIDWRLSLIVSIFVPITLVIVLFVKNLQRKSMQRLSAKQSNMNAYIHESIAGMKVTQSFTREETNYEIFKDLMDEYKDAWLTSRRYGIWMWPIMKNAQILSQVAFIMLGVIFMRESISAGTLVAFIGYSGNFWMPLVNISEFYNQLIQASAYLERIFETIDEDPDIQNSPTAYACPELIGHISFEHVTFGYDSSRVILNDFNLDVKPGEKIALVGPTGAGKTTVVNLISRFYDVTSGAIKIDGHDLRDVTIKSLRSQMGIMMQDTFIFSGTIIDNIRYGRLDASDEDVIQASKAVQAHNFIELMEKGYYTEVNERGSRLSTGQRQLISFARALLANPKILILDEATSSIDTQTEQAIQIGLERLLEGRTSFVIAHRLSTIKHSDRILVINHQGIEEMGTHDELIQKEGHYRNLYEGQLKFLL